MTVLKHLVAGGVLLVGYILSAQAQSERFIDSRYFADAVDKGELPLIEDRLPETPSIVNIKALGLEPGRHGGTLTMAMRRTKDTRQMVVYSYARLVKYTRELDLKADILESVDVEDDRIFTLHLREGHKWSDGHPVTAEDFRYWWEDIANNEHLYPVGPPASLKINGKFPTVEFIDDYTVRYAWDTANPTFLPLLARANPLYIYAPAHYLKTFHVDYQDPDKLAALVAEAGAKDWSALHTKRGRAYKIQNPDLPTLQPWALITHPPTQRYVFERNPYFHRVDEYGHQLPYIDRFVFNITEKKLIPLKAATGEVDLQARYLSFDNISLLKQSEEQYGFTTKLWRNGKGAHMALFPNLNHRDPIWRGLLRDVRFRRALSLATNRYELNQVMYYGLAVPGQNTLLPQSPLYKPEYREKWAERDVDEANRLLDAIGLTERDGRGVRLLPNGEPLEIIIETADSGAEQSDLLQLLADSWMDAGVKLHIKPTSWDVLTQRIFSGRTVMTIASGWENGMATADMAPNDLAPIRQDQYQWPMWGQYRQTGGVSGEPIDMQPVKELQTLYHDWFLAKDTAAREAIWRRMLEIHTENVFTIGLVAGTLQPVVVRNGLHNVPEEGIWNWDPGAHFGIYSPDLFWFDPGVGDN